jgi:RNA polymerase sigma-70 factor (sigma-E family)
MLLAQRHFRQHPDIGTSEHNADVRMLAHPPMRVTLIPAGCEPVPSIGRVAGRCGSVSRGTGRRNSRGRDNLCGIPSGSMGVEALVNGVTVRDRSVPASFDEFVASRGDALWRSAWLLTGDAQKAEDLVQTALGKCWTKWARVGGDGSFEAYVRRAMFTTYASWWQRAWNGEHPVADLPETAVSEPDTALRTDVICALAGLPRRQRATVVLRYFEDLSERETAELLGCSIGTVKSQTARALTTLRASTVLRPEEER